MNIIFMGTPDFAVPCLKALAESGENIKAVFTQPDKPKGRGYKLIPTPVKAAATELGIDVYQPLSLKKGEDAENALSVIEGIKPDLIIVVAYGKILPKHILDIPQYGCINVHASLLPKYRGAAPIQWSILNGEKETGVTTMMMAEGLDTGDMLISKKIPIGENETLSELHDRLSECGAGVLLDTLAALRAGNLKRIPQSDADSSYSPMITKDLSSLDFSQPALTIHNKIRAITGYAFINGKRIKIFRSELAGNADSKEAGLIENISDFSVVCGDGKLIRLTEIQPEGGKRLKSADYLRGNRLEKGTKLQSGI